MRRKHFVGLDVHCQFMEMAIVSDTGKLLRRLQCPTTIPALVRALQSVGRPLAARHKGVADKTVPDTLAILRLASFRPSW